MQHDGPEQSKRIIFLDYLRAVACLLVIFGHIYLVGPNDPKTVGVWVPTVVGYIFGPDTITRNSYGLAMDGLTLQTGINVGQLGVALFFLVSGFVILRALDKEAWLDFLVRRIFRIFPANVVSVVGIAMVTAIFCHHYHVRSPDTFQNVASSALLVMNYTADLPVMPVLWTLEVEVLFYIVMAMVSARTHIEKKTVLTVAMGCLCATIYIDFLAHDFKLFAIYSSRFVHFGSDLVLLTFLLIGAMLYRISSEGWSSESYVYLAASVAVHYAASISHNGLTNGIGTGISSSSSAAALIIFASAFRAKMEWKWIRPLRWLGDISYSVYLVHIPLGWMVLATLANHGWSIHVAGFTTVVVIVACAWVLHETVEDPSRRLGRMLARKRGSVRPMSALSVSE